MIQPLESGVVGTHIVVTFILGYPKILWKGIWIDIVDWLMGRNARNYSALDKQKAENAFFKICSESFQGFFRYVIHSKC